MESLTKEDVAELLLEHEEKEKQVMQNLFERHMLSDQHLFIQILMKKEERKQELWERTKAHVVGWGAVAVIIFFVNSFWHDLIRLIKGS